VIVSRKRDEHPGTVDDYAGLLDMNSPAVRILLHREY
jgi:hypothetical protein